MSKRPIAKSSFALSPDFVRAMTIRDNAPKNPWTLTVGKESYRGKCRRSLGELPGAMAAIYLAMSTDDRLKFLAWCSYAASPDDLLRISMELFQKVIEAVTWEQTEEGRKSRQQVVAAIKALNQTLKDLRARIDRQTRKPMNRERDRRIVEMHDEDGQSFGQIGKKFGLSYSGAAHAYHREKKLIAARK